MNHPSNGLAVDAWRQAARQGEQAGHLIYNSRVKAGLDEIERVYGIDNPEILLRELNKFENYFRNIINANPNLHL